MTIELIEYKCPICTHILGEEEYRNANNKFNNILQDKFKQKIEEIEGTHEQELYEKHKNHTFELQEQEKKHKEEINTKVNQEVKLQLDKKIQEKEDEKNAIILQAANDIDNKITEALEKQEEKNRKEKIQNELTWDRIQRDNDRLQRDNEQLQKTLANLSPEFNGKVGEIWLLDELHKAFPHDHLIPQTNGVEMPDVVQTIVKENGDRICTPILWDMKTGETVTPKDIEKVKKYKEKYNSDYCIVVTANGITAKDSKIYQTSLIGKREGVLIVHPKIVVGVAELTRNFLIEKAKLIKNNNGKAAKQTKLYEYITSSARFRKMQEKMVKKIKLDDLQRLEEAYIIKLWKEAKKLRQDWYDLDRDDQENINAIIQEEECNNDQDTDQTRKDMKEEED
jgi:hypothetical protein